MPGDCPAVAASAVSSPVENIPFQAERYSGARQKVFAFRPECRSGSQRNGVRLHSGIAFTFDRIPQFFVQVRRLASTCTSSSLKRQRWCCAIALASSRNIALPEISLEQAVGKTGAAFVLYVSARPGGIHMHQDEARRSRREAIKRGVKEQESLLTQMSGGDSQRFSLCRYRRSAALIMVESSIENALAISASVRRVGLLVPRSSWPI